MMKSEKLKSTRNGVEAFCSFVFVLWLVWLVEQGRRGVRNL